MSVSNSVFVLHLLTAQELIALFSMSTYKLNGPNFARSCTQSEDAIYMYEVNAKFMNYVLLCFLAHTENYIFP